MKIHLLSDLHLSVQAMAAPRVAADVVVLAGDLGRPAAAMAWARGFEPLPTLMVAGNHEFYGSDLATTLAALREQAKGSGVHLLERETWHHGSVRFLGCTLWSDLRLPGCDDAAAIEQATRLVRDFSRIRVADGFDQTFTPALSRALFDASVAWLDARFAEPHDGPTVVVTHHAPSPSSIHPRFAGSPVNGCFVSDLEARIRRWRPALWLHGHTHDSFDYRIGDTRVVANPRGYAPGGVVENAAFDPHLVIELA